MGRSCRGPRQPGSYTASSNTRAWWTSRCLPQPQWRREPQPQVLSTLIFLIPPQSVKWVERETFYLQTRRLQLGESLVCPLSLCYFIVFEVPPVYCSLHHIAWTPLHSLTSGPVLLSFAMGAAGINSTDCPIIPSKLLPGGQPFCPLNLVLGAEG